MENIWGSGQASATATAEVRIPVNRPNDIAVGVIQPTEPVVRFAWVIERQGGNKNTSVSCVAVGSQARRPWLSLILKAITARNE